ncbi:MAG: translation initiation factor IF-3 [candidate division Zixibacteria bacterium]|nr:translation initiation factor IF-3 [candidate division Zixibacteria bacterium]NIR64643.1 translation initiation factor IF-3 [candidate division Zixibacteria bacterium]NIS16836.1 translation initiation factor IF-3 [candidate division Zixibacteria bacterium]NIS46504.1 translation initiation factor IF-3 [candidate division Zixibacteria bacterium]NIT53236.1 translation initiation factor IF-3 [candidate division Zixibacteria bacterium]
MRVNSRIRAPQVRVIDTDGSQIGIMPTREAVEKAYEKGLDLVEVSPNAKPPVCRILDFGKYKYEQSKKAKAAKKKQHTVQLKEMRYRPKIEEHDYNFKTKHVKEFLLQGYKVKVFVEFRGREMAHIEFGKKIMERLQEDLSEVAVVEQKPKMEGRNLIMIVMPKT